MLQDSESSACVVDARDMEHAGPNGETCAFGVIFENKDLEKTVQRKDQGDDR